MLKKLKLAGIIIVVLFLGVISFLVFGSYSEGARAGTLVKLSKRGVLFKTTEGEINMQMFVGDDGAASGLATQMWDFTVPNSDAEVVDKLEQAMLNGHRVKLYYKEKYFRFFWNGDTKYYVYKVDVLK